VQGWLTKCAIDMNNILQMFFIGLLLTGLDNAKAADIKYPDVEPQVSFKSITELPVSQPDNSMAYGDDPLQHGLVWLSKTTTHKPLIILIHGGCWLNAFGVDHVYPMATALSQTGHPVWALEYRRTGDAGGGWPGSFDDIKQALQNGHLLSQYGIQTNQPILMGHSAGGHLALLAASDFPEDYFSQVIGLAAITDISRYALGDNSCQQATSVFMGGPPHEQSSAYQAANLIGRKLPDNVILMQGEADRIVPVIQSQLYDTPRMLVKQAGHFDWIHPGSPAFKTLLEVINK